MTQSRNASLQSLGSIDRQTRREQILSRLREAISSGQLAAGTHLAEIELSDALGVSRGTLREALRHLQQEGLLISDARGRLSVRKVSGAEVREIFAVRAALESLALAEICALPDRSEIVNDMLTMLDRLKDTEDNFAAQIDADLAFHETLCTASGNGTLLQAWLNVSGLARAAITAAGPETALNNMAHTRHAPFVEFIKSGDVEAGKQFLEEHMRIAADRILERMEQSADSE
ncbi:GntR family transcriptional regulator [Lysinibacter cavernae]|uniref:DNA-binding GntR family transcriptional regulator n=1 Tax=Lysinibacter cavernae TaxID=1640652 RepID=A0A7X5R1E6_9MICO|nr:GntR family transcriptional regulator [Lysinibacter cavernae]NIH53727.1 DNA-binding GntR family transcriptional regulator [Lysinibacter cavernae]